MSPVVIKPSSTKHNILLSVIAVTLLFMGFYLSRITFWDTEWLSRFGSLIVILGIGSGFTGIIQERVLLGRLEIKRRIEVARSKRKCRKMNAQADYIEKELKSINDHFEQEEDILAQAIKFSFGMMEGVLLIIGTLVWGFGDLFVVIF